MSSALSRPPAPAEADGVQISGYRSPACERFGEVAQEHRSSRCTRRQDELATNVLAPEATST